MYFATKAKVYSSGERFVCVCAVASDSRLIVQSSSVEFGAYPFVSALCWTVVECEIRQTKEEKKNWHQQPTNKPISIILFKYALESKPWNNSQNKDETIWE